MSAPTNDSRRDGEPDDEDDESDDEGDWFSSFLEGFGDADNDDQVETCVQPPCLVAATDDELPAVVSRLRQPTSATTDKTTTNEVVRDYQERMRIVQANMGSMAQCRGDRGELLRRAGAIDALLSTLWELFDRIPRPTTDDKLKEDEEKEYRYSNVDTAILELAIACMGAVRDLACGLALNRRAVRNFRASDSQATSGLQMLASYLELYHRMPWNNVPRPFHLRLLTNIIGALRNVTHSTPENCLELHRSNVTDMLVWRLLYGEEAHNSTEALPDTLCPWREASFRASATLINMAEKCDECAGQCGRNVTLINYLVGSWGGQKASLLHIGLLAILRAAKEEIPTDQYDSSWDEILTNEEDRKRYARQKEEQRKERILKRIARGDPYVGEELTEDGNVDGDDDEGY